MTFFNLLTKQRTYQILILNDRPYSWSARVKYYYILRLDEVQILFNGDKNSLTSLPYMYVCR